MHCKYKSTSINIRLTKLYCRFIATTVLLYFTYCFARPREVTNECKRYSVEAFSSVYCHFATTRLFFSRTRRARAHYRDHSSKAIVKIEQVIYSREIVLYCFLVNTRDREKERERIRCRLSNFCHLRTTGSLFVCNLIERMFVANYIFYLAVYNYRYRSYQTR